MKTTTPSRKFPALATVLAILITCGSSLQTAQADYIVSLQQVGPNVVATGSGAIDLTGLAFVGSDFIVTASIDPQVAWIRTGSTATFFGDGYTGFSGPTNFGTGSLTIADSGSGDQIFFGGGFGVMDLPAGYASGTPLLSSATWDSTNFSQLGVTPGTYVWTWGTGVHRDSFTLVVPDSGSTFGLLFLGLVALFGINRFRACRLA